MASTSVVRVGPCHDNVSAKVLQNALVSYLEKLDQSSGVKSASGQSSSINEDGTLTIRNKYFSAKILFQSLEESLPDDLDSGSKEDGIILCFPSLESNPDRVTGAGTTFNSLESVHQSATEKNTCGDLLRLCVGVSFEDLSPSEVRGKDYEDEYSRRILWCLDHGYEYVEANVSKEGQLVGHNERDKEGFSRIIEALQGTVWTSAIMGSSNNQKKETSTGSDAKEEIAADSSNTSNDQQITSHQIVKERIIGQLMSSEDDEGETTPVAQPQIAGKGDEGATSTLEEDKTEDDTEKIFDQMSKLLQQASQIREESKAGALSDGDRRERAGEAALSLMTLMNQLGLDGDEDEGDDDDDSLDENSLVDSSP